MLDIHEIRFMTPVFAQGFVDVASKGGNMWAAVRRYEGVTDPAEAGRLVAESFVPLLEHVPGFISYYWLDAGDGVMASLSVYDDQAGADESVRIAHDWVRENATALLPNAPQVIEGHVVASATK
jgi:hypothetical protein